MFIRNIVLLFYIWTCGVWALNLTLHDYHAPSASHILDAEIADQTLIVTGMLGGIDFYDIY